MSPLSGLPISQSLASTSISKFMHRQVFYALSNTSIRVAMRTMITHKVSGLPVLDQSSKCVGVYSELDAMIQGASQGLNSPIKYTAPVHSAKVDDTFKEVLLILVKNHIKRVPVLDGTHKLVGVVSRSDMMKALMDDFEAEEKAKPKP